MTLNSRLGFGGCGGELAVRTRKVAGTDMWAGRFSGKEIEITPENRLGWEKSG
jgi:hypothetical protein